MYVCGDVYFKIAAVIGSCESSLSTSYAYFTLYLTEPSNVTASQSGTAVNVSWDRVLNATSYTVHRSSTASGTYSPLLDGTTSNNYYTDKLTIDNGELIIDNVEIFNMYGRNVYSSPVTSPSSLVSINISHLSAGIYFFKVYTDKGFAVSKIVKE